LNPKLKKLLENRAAAHAAYEEFVNPLIEQEEAISPEQETERVALRSKVEQFDARIDEVRAESARESQLAEARHAAGLDRPEVRDAERSDVNAAVVHEPTVYGEGSPNSYFADICRSESRAWKDHNGAIARLDKATHEVAHEMVQFERSGKASERAKARDIASLLTNELRGEDQRPAQNALAGYREFGRVGWGEIEGRSSGSNPEVRTGMTTGAGSGGSFSTPVYQVADYAPYRQFGRVFIDQCHKEPLPEYGMTVYIPHLLGPAGVSAQTEGTGVTEVDPTAGYLSSGVITEAGEVVISQQLLDRAGPNFRFDVMVFDQLNRAHALQVDTFALNAALAGAGNVSYAGSQFNLVQPSGQTSFYTRIGNAKKNIADAAGTVLPATHLFATPDRWEEIEGWTDVNARPVILPTPAVALAPVAVGGDGSPTPPEGATGYKMRNLMTFEDGNIPTPAAGNDQVIVANMDEVWMFEGDKVPRTIPQTYAQNLQTLLQLYSYIACIPRYPLAVQSISGSGMTVPTY
jgi:hypothetical protein